MAREEWTRELRKGAFQLCLLHLLSSGHWYGFQIIKELKDRSGGYIVLKEGTLYPALHRMEARGLITGEWSVVGDRARRYYTITPKGEEALAEGRREWQRMVASVRSVMEPRG